MERTTRILVPICKTLAQPSRTFFTRRCLAPTPYLRFEDHIRDMESHFERFERDISGFLNPWRKVIPSIGFGKTRMQVYESEIHGKYQVNVVIGDEIPPENIKVTLMDRVVKVEAKYQNKTSDGKASVSQEFMRQFTIPANVDLTQIKSLFTPEGILQIEAPLPLDNNSSNCKEIPINVEMGAK